MSFGLEFVHMHGSLVSMLYEWRYCRSLGLEDTHWMLTLFMSWVPLA